MKLKNILPTVCILLAAVSCSMEDELNDVPTKGDATTEAGIAYLSFNVDAQQVLTKADKSHLDGETPADAVSDCSLIILMNDGSMYRAYDGLKIENGVVKTVVGGNAFKVQVKVGKEPTTADKTFKVMVVANTVQTYATCADYAAVQAKLLNDVDMNKRVKVSEPEAVVVNTYSTVDEAIANPTPATLVAKQITARIKLASFDVKFKDGTDSVNVKIKNITLVNQNTKSATVINDSNNKLYANPLWNNGATLPIP